MSEEFLFDAEENIIRRAEEALSDKGKDDVSMRKEFESLLKNYKKTYKQLRRLIKINDKQAKKLNEANEKLTQLSRVDGLTGVKNRRYFNEQLESEWLRACREKGALSLLLLDIDNFKNINDSYGHQAGDECLKQISKILLSFAKRSSDFVARYGGEEFCVILPNTVSAGASSLAKSIRRAIESTEVCYDCQSIKMTVSIGVATQFPEHAEVFSLLLTQADDALYQAKQQGRNRVCSFSNS